MAMACLRLLTLLPLRPLFSVPFFRFRIVRSTSLEALFEYLRAILLLLNRTIIPAAASVFGPRPVTAKYRTLFQEMGAPTVRDGHMTRSRQRADILLVERGLFESRAKAQAAIEAGLVTADQRIVRKASEEVATSAVLRAKPAHPYVSRGGVKLAAALDHFHLDPKERVCLDVGASTGGFAQVLLERGAKLVYAVDVGRGQLHESLRARPDIVEMEETDIRKLSPAGLGDAADFVTIDVSFISLKLVLPPALALAKPAACLVVLIKP